LQVLRYNESAAYIQHMDYLQDKSGKELYVSFICTRTPFSI
jgi:hypothetical protein